MYKVENTMGSAWCEVHSCNQMPRNVTVRRRIAPSGYYYGWQLVMFHGPLNIRCCPFCGALLYNRRKPANPWPETA